MYIEDGQVSLFDQDTWSGRTCPEPSAAEAPKGRTSQRSLKNSSKSQSRMPRCVCCRRVTDGQNPAVTMIAMDDGRLLGEYTMRSFGECPREENVSRLSQILEDSPHPKYSLSAKACLGVLRRAARRGRDLPEQLEAALIAQAGLEMKIVQEMKMSGKIDLDEYWEKLVEDLKQSVSKNEPGNQGGKGILIQSERTGALSTLNNQSVFSFSAGQGEKAGGIGWQEECSPSLKAANSGTNMVPAVLPFDTTQITSPQNGNKPNYGDPCHPLAAGAHAPAVVMVMQAFGDYKRSESASGCKGRDYKDATDLVVSVDCRNGYENEELSGTIQAKENGGQSLNCINPVRRDNLVRRLTPLECERLQGYPDGWTDIGEWTDSKGKKRKEADSPRYKALGNSIALPFWKVLAKRISAQYDRDITMGSLFDGIGGFPLVFEQINGKGTARWASEIEEFPMAVTKLRFGED